LTHVVSISGIYDLPIGRGRRVDLSNRFLNYALGNWQVNSIFLARSGLPYNIFVNADVANTGNLGWLQYERANLVGDPHLDHPDRERWFDTGAFEIPALYTFGNLGRHRLRSAAYWNLDLSVFRTFPLGEGKRLELRVEAFNVVNTVIYGPPHNDMTDPDFGKVTGVANTPRILQFAARVVF
jgi:hypothetical protein